MSDQVTSLAAEIVSAYVSNNNIRSSDVPDLVMSVHASLSQITGATPEQPVDSKSEPAVSVKKSVHDDYLISLIDGNRYKTLKRHLNGHGMTPDQYRERYDLPASYPMVCKAYAAVRSELAKKIGLGNARKQSLAEPEQVRAVPEQVEAPVQVKRSAKPHSKPKDAVKNKSRKANAAAEATA